MQFKKLLILCKPKIPWSFKEHMKWVQDRVLFDGCFTVSNDDRSERISSFMESRGGCLGG